MMMLNSVVIAAYFWTIMECPRGPSSNELENHRPDRVFFQVIAKQMRRGRTSEAQVLTRLDCRRFRFLSLSHLSGCPY
jgi:hypothetical protein